MSAPIRDNNGHILAHDGLRTLRGDFPGVLWINKYGHNPSAAAGDAVWSPGTAIPAPAAAAKLNVASTSLNDNGVTGPGTGAWTVEIDGIDDNYDRVIETVTLDGTTAVETVASFWWVNSAKVITGSTFAGNIGTISMTTQASGTPLLGEIMIGENSTTTAQYMVPRNHTAYIRLPQITLQNTGNNTLMDLQLFRRHWADHANGVDRLMFDTLLQAGSNSDYQQKDWIAPLEFPGKTIVYWKVKSVSGGGTFDLVIDYDIWLINNTLNPKWIATNP